MTCARSDHRVQRIRDVEIHIEQITGAEQDH